jgi:hypothetical protein
MVAKTVFSTTRKGNVIVFDMKFPSEIVVQPYTNYRTRVYWVHMEMSNLYKGPVIDASYQVLVHLTPYVGDPG